MKAVRANERSGFLYKCLRSGGCEWKRSGRNERTRQRSRSEVTRSTRAGPWTQSCTYPASSQSARQTPTIVGGNRERESDVVSGTHSKATAGQAGSSPCLSPRFYTRAGGRTCGRSIGDPFGQDPGGWMRWSRSAKVGMNACGMWTRCRLRVQRACEIDFQGRCWLSKLRCNAVISGKTSRCIACRWAGLANH